MLPPNEIQNYFYRVSEISPHTIILHTLIYFVISVLYVQSGLACSPSNRHGTSRMATFCVSSYRAFMVLKSRRHLYCRLVIQCLCYKDALPIFLSLFPSGCHQLCSSQDWVKVVTLVEGMIKKNFQSWEIFLRNLKSQSG